uniref:Ribosomal protein S7 n=1 Tax=Navicula ramosissima TaxID=265559 RepID=A0A343A6W5_9STRA|nr:ribosomal protein S7 [Navicula ramosissima]AOY40403.1 ribosomal protein S7 [Navicula ramosissima]
MNIVKYKAQSLELQKKLINHATRNGKKSKSEKAIMKSFKAAQKSQRKNHGKIIKLSVLNAIPIFKIIKLTDKKRRKKSTKEIPTFVSNYTSRVSLGLKYLIKTTRSLSSSKQANFSEKFKNELLSGTSSENNASVMKTNFQTKACQEKKYFRFYRW